MNEEREDELRAWFVRSVQQLPRQPFALEVMAKVRRKQRVRRLQLCAAVLVTGIGICLALPDLVVAANKLAALPLTVIAAGRDEWPWLAPLVAGLGCWLIYRARNSGAPRGE